MATQAPTTSRVNRLLMLAHRLANWFGLELNVDGDVPAPEPINDARLMRCVITMEANEFLKMAEDVLVRMDADADVYTCKASVLANAVACELVANLGGPVDTKLEGQMTALIRQARKVRRTHDNIVRAVRAAERFARSGAGAGGDNVYESVDDFIARSKRLRAEVDTRLAATRAFLKKRRAATENDA